MIPDYMYILIHPTYADYLLKMGWDTFSAKKREYGDYEEYLKNIKRLILSLKESQIEYIHVMENLSENNIESECLPLENTITILTPDVGENHRMMAGFFGNELITGEDETLSKLIEYIRSRSKPLAFAGEYVWKEDSGGLFLPGCLSLFI
ncbi:unnamed protein product, partial [marine sediment metagenome]